MVYLHPRGTPGPDHTPSDVCTGVRAQAGLVLRTDSVKLKVFNTPDLSPRAEPNNSVY